MDRENRNMQIIQTIQIAKNLLSENILGIYLYGSAVLGGLHPNSDIDLLIVTDQSLSQNARKQLTSGLLTVSGRVGNTDKRPLEVTVVNQKDIVPWQFPPKYDYLYGEWLRDKLEVGMLPEACYDFDFTILLWQARQHSEVLYGKPAEALIPPISKEDVRKAIAYSLPGLLKYLKGDERNVLLTLARMWFTLATEKICPKDEAARWAMERMPEPLSETLKKAEKGYLGEYDDRWDNLEQELSELAAFMKEQIMNEAGLLRSPEKA